MTHRLRFDIQGFWHPGTGRGAGTALDAVTHRDSQGLPALPGRSVKGLVRAAIEQAAVLGWYGSGQDRLADRLCGWRPAVPGEDRGDLPAAGCLRFADAALPGDVIAALTDPDQGPRRRAGLYRGFSGTAVDPVTGSAREKSLRGLELIIPLTLFAPVAPIPGHTPPADWPDLLRLALPLLRGLGADRNRGLGRVTVTLEDA